MDNAYCLSLLANIDLLVKVVWAYNVKLFFQRVSFMLSTARLLLTGSLRGHFSNLAYTVGWTKPTLQCQYYIRINSDRPS